MVKIKHGVLFKLSDSSTGRLLLHATCLGLCYVLNKRSKRALALTSIGLASSAN